MIIPNGCIKFRTSGAAGVDSDGYPTRSAEAWSDGIECQVLPNVNLRAKSENEAVTKHSYVLYINRMELPSEVIMLFYEGAEIGQFSIRSYEHLDAVAQTKIVL